jgi:hypothetical protein
MMADKQARLDAWDALTPLQRLRIELEESLDERVELLADFPNTVGRSSGAVN